MKQITCLGALACGVLFAAREPEFETQRYMAHIKYLASEAMRGRGTGTPELEKAAQYVAAQFKAAGLKTLGGAFLQPFQVTANARLGPGNQLQYPGGKGRLEEDFVPFNFSTRGELSGGLVFVGYGITAREYNYDDYEGVDVKGRVVILLRHEPQEFDEKSVFQGKVYTRHSQFDSKAINAKMHGASGVILINDTGNHTGDADLLEKFGRTAGPSDAGIPMIQVRAEIVAGWMEAAGKPLKDTMAAIDGDLKPRSFSFPENVKVSGSVDVQRDVKTVHNVVGYLPGETAEYVVVGAHYDHLGLGEQYSMAPSQAGTPHLGADDNASGTAGVIELARHFQGRRLRRGILFQAYAAEELGLLGSGHYVNHPLMPLDNAVAMVNLDMIGRIRENKVILGGVATGTTFKAMMERLAAPSGLTVDYSEQAGYGSSDHTSFTTKQVPVLFFFSGLHADYHRPSDTWDKINAGGAVKLLDLIGRVTGELAASAERPAFVRVQDPRPHGTGTASGGGYGPNFGSIPDMSYNGKGVKFADVRDGAPAAKAGLKGGDVMIEFDGKPIGNLYDFTYALRAKKVGDVVPVKVTRDGTVVEVQVTLEARR
ncbi:MAG: M28 family peptidase [Acidobacteria bacterium]|nr:M28 family peptidase [Acidobacteriota bacterium]